MLLKQFLITFKLFWNFIIDLSQKIGMEGENNQSFL